MVSDIEALCSPRSPSCVVVAELLSKLLIDDPRERARLRHGEGFPYVVCHQLLRHQFAELFEDSERMSERVGDDEAGFFPPRAAAKKGKTKTKSKEPDAADSTSGYDICWLVHIGRRTHAEFSVAVFPGTSLRASTRWPSETSTRCRWPTSGPAVCLTYCSIPRCRCKVMMALCEYRLQRPDFACVRGSFLCWRARWLLIRSAVCACSEHLREIDNQHLRVMPFGHDSKGNSYFAFGFADFRICKLLLLSCQQPLLS